MGDIMTVLVISNDERSWLWEPFARAWNASGQVGIGPVLFVTREKDVEIEGFGSLPMKSDDWSTRFKAALKEINEKRVIVMMDDYLATKPVNWKEALNLTGLVVGVHPNSHYYRLSSQDGRIKKFAPNSPYQASMQAAIWDVRFLSSLLVPGESPWTFEKSATERMIQMGVCRQFIETDWYIHAVKRGNVLPEAESLL